MKIIREPEDLVFLAAVLGISFLFIVNIFPSIKYSHLEAPPAAYHCTSLTSEPPLITKIKQDINMTGPPIKVVFSHAYWGAETFGNEYGITMGISCSLYYELDPKERIALIAHELGHFLPGNLNNDLKSQMAADRFATDYAGIDATISLIDKVYPFKKYEWGDREIWKIRHDALVHLK